MRYRNIFAFKHWFCVIRRTARRYPMLVSPNTTQNLAFRPRQALTEGFLAMVIEQCVDALLHSRKRVILPRVITRAKVGQQIEPIMEKHGL